VAPRVDSGLTLRLAGPVALTGGIGYQFNPARDGRARSHAVGPNLGLLVGSGSLRVAATVVRAWVLPQGGGWGVYGWLAWSLASG